MTAKLIVLYPRPIDVDAFERRYHAHHMVLMRRLVGPSVPLHTYLVAAGRPASSAVYRVAEIVFPDRDALLSFMRTPGSRDGLASSREVSTGGEPTYLTCIEDALAPRSG